MLRTRTRRLFGEDVATLAGKLPAALPRGQTLPPDVWQRRHRSLFALLCLHAVAIPLFGLVLGSGALHAIADGAVLTALAVVAYGARRSHRLAAVVVSLGLITSSALVVHVSGGVIEAHFHFFVMIVVLALYEDWLPFLLATGYVVVHHGVTARSIPAPSTTIPTRSRIPGSGR